MELFYNVPLTFEDEEGFLAELDKLETTLVSGSKVVECRSGTVRSSSTDSPRTESDEYNFDMMGDLIDREYPKD